MNPTVAQPNSNANTASNLFEGAFERTSEFEQPEAIETTVNFTDEHLKSFRSDWNELYTRTSEGPVTRAEVELTTIETQFSQPLRIFEQEETRTEILPGAVVEKQKGSGSWMEEAGLKLNFPGLFKETKKSLFGVFSIFKEIFMDTAKVFTAGFKKETAVDPEKARAEAEKKALKQKRNNNWNSFFQAIQAQASAIISPDAARMETQEKANINIVAKIGNEAYKGIKDSFGRLTIYAASLFETAQLDQEKHAKKQEKEMKMAAVSKGPDLNMDKVAEGGFLSSTGGQGAG